MSERNARSRPTGICHVTRRGQTVLGQRAGWSAATPSRRSPPLVKHLVLLEVVEPVLDPIALEGVGDEEADAPA